jgi:hypothetical protein
MNLQMIPDAGAVLVAEEPHLFNVDKLTVQKRPAVEEVGWPTGGAVGIY